MTKQCPYCDDILLDERFDDHLQDHLVEAGKFAPPPPGRFIVKCSDTGCILFKGVRYPEIGNAEILAWAHESRRDDPATPHRCTVEDLEDVQPSLKPEAATGVKEAAHG